VVFIIPWGDRSVLGTTDTFYDGKPEDVHADRDDVAYLLRLANAYFPEAHLGPDDVLATWAGLRPLVKPDADVENASDVSREHHILKTPGMVTIAGGKLTTYRRMAAEVVDAAGAQLETAPRPSTTDVRPLPGAVGLDGYTGVGRLAEQLTQTDAKIDAQVAKHLAQTYGVRALSVVERVRQNAALGARLDPELPYILAQVDVAVDEEQAVTVEDLLGRRVPLLLRARDQGLAASRRVAERMGERLGWSASRVEAETAMYRAVVDRTRRFRS
jgi:glycerol-3-phosphate dehydrogenase